MNDSVLDLPALLQEHIDVANKTRELLDKLKKICEQAASRVQQGGKVLFCGNGGSAADAQHFAAELIGRFYLERRAIPAMALAVDSSILTCLSNDYHYDVIFARQLEAHCQDKDIVVLISTSGHSPNILKAAEVARQKGAYIVGLTGKDGGALKDMVDDCLIVPSNNTPRIQEMHGFLGHTLCEWIEKAVAQ
ncbi:MAG: phosphoheptose isomerase [Gammaproteobacteria bacterium]|jgi:D-sedoheptulose 7-phosphate isomerase|nr:phosphoheptose isomerase [Gammaproteobacteria bacterium]